MSRRVLDVGTLEAYAFTARDPLWWSMMLLIAIEATMLTLFLVSYAYVADRVSPFPPESMPRDVVWLATAEVVLWLVSCVPQRRTSKAAVRGDLHGMRRNLAVATLLAIVAVVVRIYLMKSLPFRWDEHAYGSMVWGLLAIQFTHGATSAGEDLVYVVLLFKGPVENKHRSDIEVSAPLIYFTTIGTIVLWAVLFAPALFGVGS
jgi:heme/copper-type cytochrome/quinol oxidase subunit 3